MYLVWNSYFNDKKEDNSLNSEQVEKQKESDKEDDDAGGAIEKKKIEQYDGEDPNDAETLSGVVTYAGVSNDVLMIRVNIDQYLESGECELTLLRGGSSIYNSTAEIVGGPSTASCDGFDVPVSGLGGGATEININLKSGERSGVIHGEVEI